MKVPEQVALARNPGPAWGFRFLIACDAILPEWIFRPLRWLGTLVAVYSLSDRRRHSKAYLATILPRSPGTRDVWRHFFAFEEFLMLRLRIARGRVHRGVLAPDALGFHELMRSGEQALLGSFHVGHSDLIGFLVGPQERRKVFMVRQRVGNSLDTEILGSQFRQWVNFIWVNRPENLLFAIKDAIAAGGSVAMKCDRAEFGSKAEEFTFLGARRSFPLSIYHLSILFRLPVVLAVGLPAGPGCTRVHSSPLFRPDGAGKAENLLRARAHFQDFLARLECQLRADPYLWFNFAPLESTGR